MSDKMHRPQNDPKVQKNEQLNLQNSRSSLLDEYKYDLILFLIPALLVAGVIAGMIGELGITTGIVSSSTAGVLLMTYALFVSPPIERK